MPPYSRGLILKAFARNPLRTEAVKVQHSPTSFFHNGVRLQWSTSRSIRKIPSPVVTARAFATTVQLQKKSSASSKSSRKSPSVKPSKHDTHVPDNKATLNRDREIDPYDYSELEAGISKALARLKDALAKTRDAGRVSVEMVENLPVELNVKGQATHGGSAHKERTRVGDIASVVPKGGRTIQVFCGEESVCLLGSSRMQLCSLTVLNSTSSQSQLRYKHPHIHWFRNLTHRIHCY